jgi:superoxide dismutase
MEIHHQKHHGAYVASLNMAEEKYEEANLIIQILKNMFLDIF